MLAFSAPSPIRDGPNPLDPPAMLRLPLAVAASTALLSTAAAAQADYEWDRPGWQLLPQNEDWSGVDAMDPEQRDWSDDLKWMALDDGGDWRLSIGGRARLRVEGWSNFGLTETGNPRTDDVFQLGRALAHADLQHSSGFRTFVQLKSALAWDRELPGFTRGNDEDQFDLHQGFVEHTVAFGGGDDVRLRVGRQAIEFGNMRLVGAIPWSNAMRSWDGAFATFPVGDWTFDLFWAELVTIDANEFNDSDDDALFGLYTQRPFDGDTLDLYLLGTERDDRVFNGTAGDEKRYTVGARYSRPPVPGQGYFDAELAIQRGDVETATGDEDIEAWMFGGELGMQLEGENAPRIRMMLEIGSGDSRAGGTAGTFDPLFARGHRYLGYQDLFSRRNLIDLAFGGVWSVGEDLSLLATAHQFLRANEGDTIYDLGGAPIAGTSGDLTGGSSDVGQEIDLVLTKAVNRHTRWQAGYSHFFGGSVFEDAGLDEDSDFLFFQVSFAF